MTLDDLSGDGQAEPGAARLLRPCSPRPRGENRSKTRDPVLFGDAGALVPDRHPRPALPAAHGDRDRAADRREPHRVGHDVGQGPIECGGIGVDHRARGQPQVEAQRPFGASSRYSSTTCWATSARSTSRSTKAAERFRAVASRSSSSRLIRPVARLTTAVASRRSAGVEASLPSTASTLAWIDGDGVAQLVRHVLDEGTLGPEGGLEARQHVVDRVGQRPQLVRRTARLDAPGQIGGGDLPGGGGDLLHRAQRPARDPPTDDQAESRT